MIPVGNFNNMGTKMSEVAGKDLIESMEKNPALKEAYNFKEDNTMANSGDLYTVALAKAIYYKSYDNFAHYYDLVINLTPADLGMPEGAGSYKVPKILGSTAAKLSSGEVVEYVNDNKDSVVLETETYGIGTRINRRLIKRGAKGFIQMLMKSASDAVNRAVVTDIINGLVAGAASANTKTGGVSYDNIEAAKSAVKGAVDANSILFGFIPNAIGFSNVGWLTLATSSDYKTLVQYGNRNVPGSEVKNTYEVFNGLRVYQTPLISVQKGGADVHAIVLDTDHASYALMETQMETFDGRIPGTAGDQEIIMALDFGQVINNAEAISIITA